jgi:hypothetical protein
MSVSRSLGEACGVDVPIPHRDVGRQALRPTLPQGSDSPRVLVAIPDAVARHVAGHGGVLDDRLEKRLGTTTYLAWRELCALRDPRTGEVMSPVRLRAASGRMLDDVFARLRKAGLMSRCMKRRVTRRDHTFWVNLWKIYGCPPITNNANLCAVPAPTEEWMKKPGRGGARAGTGGARPGAGRPKKADLEAALAAHVASLPDWAKPYPKTDRKNHQSTVVEFTKAPGPLKISSSDHSISSLREEMPPPAAGPVPLRGETREPSAPLHPVCDGGHPLVPPFVSLSTVARVEIPDPPLFHENELPARRVYLLARWYEGVYQAEFKKACWTFKSEKVHISKSKWAPLLEKAAELMMAKDIRAAAWIRFSFAVWKNTMKKSTPPPISFVFNLSRIDGSSGWYRSEYESYSGGKLVFSTLARSFMESYYAMQRDFRSLPADAGDDAILAIVNHRFPGGHQVWLDLVKEESARLRQDMLDRLSCGDWIWHPRATVVDGDWCWWPT